MLWAGLTVKVGVMDELIETLQQVEDLLDKFIEVDLPDALEVEDLAGWEDAARLIFQLSKIRQSAVAGSKALLPILAGDMVVAP